MHNYKDVLNDKIIQDIYFKIGQKNDYFWADHSIKHIKSVLKNIKTICKLLKISKYDENLCLIAGVLHDVGALQGKQNHALRSYEFAKAYLNEKFLNKDDNQKVEFAIKNHSSFDKDISLVTKILVLADKCDITKSRVTNVGLTQLGIREYANINNVLMSFDNNIFKVKILTNNQFNKEEFLDFYFTKNLFLAGNNLVENFENVIFELYINDDLIYNV